MLVELDAVSQSCRVDFGVAERLQDNRQLIPAVQGLDLSFFTELSVSMLKLGGHFEVGGWLPVSLTEFGHGHDFNNKADGGPVRYQPPARERKIVWRPPKWGEKGGCEARAWRSEGSAALGGVETTLAPRPYPSR